MREEIIKELRKAEEGFAVCSAFLCLYGGNSKNKEICSQGIRAKKQMEIFREAAKMLEEDKKERENRVLTLEELEAHCKGGADAAPVWIEYKITKELSRWIYILEPEGVFGAQTIVSYKHNSNWRKRYGTFWRCWLRKPTAEEMANAPWEE